MPRRTPALVVVATLLGGLLTGQVVTGSTAGAAVAPFTPGDVAVYRVGSGASALSSSGTAVFLDEYAPSGALVQSVPMPTVPSTASGANKALVASGSASSEGELTLSADSRYLVATGYNAALGTGSVASTASSAVSRTVGRVDATGTVDTTTSLTDAPTGNNVRSATTDDGTRFWVAGGAGGVRYAPLGAGTSTQVSGGTTVNFRQALVAGGQLYTSASSNGTLLATVGSGLPTTAGQPVANLAFSSAPNSPYGYSFLTLGTGTAPDTLYVADNGAGAVVKYTLINGTWTAKGSVTLSGVTGLTANDDHGTVTLFATTATGLSRITDTSGLGGTLSGSATSIATPGANTAFRGVAFTPGTVIGSGSGTPPANPPSVTPDHTGLPAALGDPTNPADGLTLADDTYPAEQLTLTATSSNQTVLPDSGIAISGTGGTRTLSAAPSGTGTATITLTVTAPDATSSTSSITYAVSADLSGAGAGYYSGAGNASAAIDVGDGYFIAADDENNTLRLYRHGTSGPPVRTFAFAQLPSADELDLETAARSGDTIYWGGSMSNTSGGNPAPARDTLFATTVSGSGADTTLTYAGRYTSLKEDLVAWDQAHGDALGLAASAAPGLGSHDPTGLNMEGMEFSADGSALYLGFRAPLEPPTDRHLALLVPLTDVASLMGAPAGSATFGDPVELDLGGLAVRDIRKNADGQYLILAGTADDSNSSFVLYQWDGDPADDPRPTGTTLPTLPAAGNSSSWETIVSVPDPLTPGAEVPLVQDDGTVDWYGTGQTTKSGLPADLAKSLGVDLAYAAPGKQSTTTALAVDDASPVAGEQVTYTATVATGAQATGTPSGSVAFSDGATGIDGCTASPLDAGTATCVVTYADAGTHSVTATYSGDDDFAASAADPVTVTVGVAEQLSWTRPADLTYGDPLAAAQLDAQANVDGSFSYTLADGTPVHPGTVLPAGSYGLIATFVPADSRYPTGTVTTTLTVDPAPLSVKANPGKWQYGSPTPLTVTYSGLVNGDKAAVLGTPTFTATPKAGGTPTVPGAGTGAGKYALIPGGLSSPNYTIRYTAGTLTVRKAPLTVTVNSVSRPRGQANPPFTLSYAGFVNDDTPDTAVTGTPKFSTKAGDRSAPATYRVTVKGLAAANYTITYVDGTVTVT